MDRTREMGVGGSKNESREVSRLRLDLTSCEDAPAVQAKIIKTLESKSIDPDSIMLRALSKVEMSDPVAQRNLTKFGFVTNKDKEAGFKVFSLKDIGSMRAHLETGDWKSLVVYRVDHLTKTDDETFFVGERGRPLESILCIFDILDSRQDR